MLTNFLSPEGIGRNTPCSMLFAAMTRLKIPAAGFIHALHALYEIPRVYSTCSDAG